SLRCTRLTPIMPQTRPEEVSSTSTVRSFRSPMVAAPSQRATPSLEFTSPTALESSSISTRRSQATRSQARLCMLLDLAARLRRVPMLLLRRALIPLLRRAPMLLPRRAPMLLNTLIRLPRKALTLPRRRACLKRARATWNPITLRLLRNTLRLRRILLPDLRLRIAPLTCLPPAPRWLPTLSRLLPLLASAT
ncbi:hypothetical protein IWW50_002676, partial [Coemansia erecta]